MFLHHASKKRGEPELRVRQRSGACLTSVRPAAELGNTSWALADIKDQQCQLQDSSYVLAKTQSCQNDGPDYAGQGVSLDGERVGLETDLTIPMQPSIEVGPEAPFMIEDDQENFYDPTLDTFRMLLEANDTQIYLESLNPEGRQTAKVLAGAESGSLIGLRVANLVAIEDCGALYGDCGVGAVLLVNSLTDHIGFCELGAFLPVNKLTSNPAAQSSKIYASVESGFESWCSVLGLGAVRWSGAILRQGDSLS
ncbi:hypothetical protein Nepgr_019201 [Nepenthes gracilis]|uniref:Uncharacterized protein n=1 Tax=Nepenthes gracilis TaxID=150966 RepID=A0AAD3ST26_NEPGR|nr:hypothetical protein Nepgr_019201 [Nepenthes gracilis]